MNKFKQGDKVYLNKSSRHDYLIFDKPYTITFKTGDWISFAKRSRLNDLQYHPYDLFISSTQYRLRKINKLLNKIK
jgi:hypothetical protein